LVRTVAKVDLDRYAGEWFEALLAGLDENRRLLASLVAGHLPEVRYRQPEGTYFAWLDCRALDLGVDPATITKELDRVRVETIGASTLVAF